QAQAFAFLFQPTDPPAAHSPPLPRERFSPNVDSSRPVRANSGHWRTAQRTGQGDAAVGFGSSSAMASPLVLGATDPKPSSGLSQRHFLTSGQVEFASLPNACSPDIFWTIR